jgi:hypothetical protein
MYLRNMICFRYIIVNTLHKVDNNTTTTNNNNNNNSKGKAIPLQALRVPGG